MLEVAALLQLLYILLNRWKEQDIHRLTVHFLLHLIEECTSATGATNILLALLDNFLYLENLVLVVLGCLNFSLQVGCQAVDTPLIHVFRERKLERALVSLVFAQTHQLLLALLLDSLQVWIARSTENVRGRSWEKVEMPGSNQIPLHHHPEV